MIHITGVVKRTQRYKNAYAQHITGACTNNMHNTCCWCTYSILKRNEQWSNAPTISVTFGQHHT